MTRKETIAIRFIDGLNPRTSTIEEEWPPPETIKDHTGMTYYKVREFPKEEEPQYARRGAEYSVRGAHRQ